MKKSSQLFGKFGENYIIGILLENDFEVFRPEFDRGTDLIVKSGKNMLSVQIKTRNYQTALDRHMIIHKEDLKENDVLIYVIYNGRNNINFLVLPTKEVLKWKHTKDGARIHYPIKCNSINGKTDIRFEYKGRVWNLHKFANENGINFLRKRIA